MQRPLIFLAAAACLTLAGCRSATTWYEMGEASYLRRDYDSSLYQYRRARAKDASLPQIDEKIRHSEIRVYLTRGDRAVQQRRWAVAERAYGEVRRLDPDNLEVDERLRRLAAARADYHFQAAQELMVKGDARASIAELEQALMFQPDHPRAAEALERARSDLRDRERKSELAFQDGQRAAREGRYDEATQHYRRALDLDPQHVGARRELRDVLTRRAEALVQEGDALMERGRWEEALSVFQRAREHDPGFAGLEARIRRAENEARAMTLVEEANRAFDRGNWRAAHDRFAEAWALTSNREHFRQRYETSREQLCTGLYSRAQAAERSGRSRKALELYLSLRDFSPGYRDVEIRCERLSTGLATSEREYDEGCRAQKARDLPRALRHFEACYLSMPGYRDIEKRRAAVRNALELAAGLYNRALAAESRGEWRRARTLLEECLSISSPYRDAAERIARRPGPGPGQRHGHEHIQLVGVRRQYDEACRAQDAKNLTRALELFQACLVARPGYRDVAVRQQAIELGLAKARRLRRRAVAAEDAAELERARNLYTESLAVCRPFSDVAERLQRVVASIGTLEEARRLDRERRLTAARKRYVRLLKQYSRHDEAIRRVRAITRILDQLRPSYEELLAAERKHRFRRALALARQMSKQCVDFEDLEERVPRLESEVDYLEGLAFEKKGQFDRALLCYELCFERTPAFRDVESRLRALRSDRHRKPRPPKHWRGRGRHGRGHDGRDRDAGHDGDDHDGDRHDGDDHDGDRHDGDDHDGHDHHADDRDRDGDDHDADDREGTAPGGRGRGNRREGEGGSSRG